MLAKDDTAQAKFVLLDWIAWPVIGVTAEKLLDGSLDEVFSDVNDLFMLPYLELLANVYILLFKILL